MVLVDTSIWIDHLRQSDFRMVKLLDADLVCMHPFILGELACGNLADRKNRLYLLSRLPQTEIVTDREVLFFVEKHRAAGKGVGYLDMHLLAAAALGALKLWTRDRRLNELASKLGLDASMNS